MIFYNDMNDDLNIFDSEFFDTQKNQDPLLEIAVAIVERGYRGLVVHTKHLASGKYFFGINFREDTPEGKIFSRIKADFHRGRAIPNSRVVLKKIKTDYSRKVTL